MALNRMAWTSLLSMVALVTASGISACSKPSPGEVRSKTTVDATLKAEPSTSSNPEKAADENAKAKEALAKVNNEAIADNDAESAKAAADAEEKRRAANAESLTRLKEILDQESGAGAALTAKEKSGEGEKSSPAAVDISTKKAFVMSLVEPTMRFNNAIMLQRIEALRLFTKTSKGIYLLPSDIELMSRLKREFLPELSDASNGSISNEQAAIQLLARINVVHAAFLAAPLALESNWVPLTPASQSLIASRMLELNTSLQPNKVRFRAARMALEPSSEASSGRVVSLELMKAFVEGSSSVTSEKMIGAVQEILEIIATPEVQSEIQRVYELLRSQNLALATKTTMAKSSN